jgi:flagellin
MKVSLGTNIASLSSIRRLDRSNQELSTVFERLSSGQRINRASDDAASLAVASKLQTDARIAGQAINNISYGVSLLSIADQALQSLTDIVTRQLELAEQSANGIFSTEQRIALDTEAQALRGEYNRIISTTSFNNLNLLNGDIASVFIQAGVGEANAIGVDILKEQEFLAENTGTFTMLGAGTPGFGENILGEARLLVLDNTEGQDILVAMSWVRNTGTNRLALLIQTYSQNEDGDFVKIAQEAIATNQVPLTATFASVSAQIVGGDLRVQYATDSASGTTTRTISSTGVLGVAGAYGGGVFDQTDTTVVGSFSGLAEGETVSVDILGVGTNIPLNYSTNTLEYGFEDLSQTSFSLTDANLALAAITRLNEDLTSLSDLRSTLGAAGNRLMVASEVVRNSRDQFLSANSRIIDADITQESANLVRLSILQEASAAVLAQSNQQPALVLELLSNP